MTSLAQLTVINQLRGGMQLMVKTLDGKTVTVSQNSGQLCLLTAMP